MPVKVFCPNPSCDASFSLSEDRLDQALRCKRCGTRFVANDDSPGEIPYPPTRSSSPRPDTHSIDLPTRFGRYEVLKKLGQGGMGAVYLARDHDLDRTVALKVPILGRGENTSLDLRFQREAKAAAAFRHPNFCPIYEVGRVGDCPYFAMAYIEGESLSTYVERGVLKAERESVTLIRKLALAMAQAHERGIIHRDLKPANIMMDDQGEPIIMDFGLARRSAADDPDLTASGAILGTPHYMAPEQLKSDRHKIGPAADVYSLGVVLYEILTGHRPFKGGIEQVIAAKLYDEPPLPTSFRPDLTIQLQEICLKSMAKEVEGRFASMRDLAGALDDYLRSHPRSNDREAQFGGGDTTEPQPKRASNTDGRVVEADYAWARYGGDPTSFIPECHKPKQLEDQIEVLASENGLGRLIREYSCEQENHELHRNRLARSKIRNFVVVMIIVLVAAGLLLSAWRFDGIVLICYIVAMSYFYYWRKPVLCSVSRLKFYEERMFGLKIHIFAQGFLMSRPSAAPLICRWDEVEDVSEAELIREDEHDSARRDHLLIVKARDRKIEVPYIEVLDLADPLDLYVVAADAIRIASCLAIMSRVEMDHRLRMRLFTMLMECKTPRHDRTEFAAVGVKDSYNGQARKSLAFLDAMYPFNEQAAMGVCMALSSRFAEVRLEAARSLSSHAVEEALPLSPRLMLEAIETAKAHGPDLVCRELEKLEAHVIAQDWISPSDS